MPTETAREERTQVKEHCVRCGYDWWPRDGSPVSCPNCKQRNYSAPPKHRHGQRRARG